jgi:hypothetical protein
VFGAETSIRNLSLDAERDDVLNEQVLYDHPTGVFTVARRANGQVYFSDSEGIYRLDPA